MMREVLLLSIFISLFTSCDNISNNKFDNGDVVEKHVLPKNATPIIYTYYIYLNGLIESANGNVLLDTAGDHLYLDSVFYADNNLTYDNYDYGEVSGIGTSVHKTTTILDTVTFTFGNYVYKINYVPVLKLKPIGGDYVDGLLGNDYFVNSVLEINYAKEYINVFKTIDSVDISDYGVIPLKKVNHFFCMPLTVKISNTISITGDFIIDTASPTSTITSFVAKTNNLNKKVERKIRYYTMYGGLGGESSGYDFIADSLIISDYLLENVNMSFSADTSGLLQSGPYIGILGNNILEKFDILFDFKNRNLYLKPNEDFSKPYVFDRVGFSFVDRCKTQGGWIVTGLSENSPAEKQNLRIDDKIISVNQVPVEKILQKSQKGYFDKFDKVHLTVLREDSLKQISFKLAPLIK